MVWTRYCLVITPINYYLSSVNFFVGCTGIAQLVRIALYRYKHPEALESQSPTATSAQSTKPEVIAAS
ncbi:putative mitochondrial pyruvate carrier 2 [Ditylenchus destructor]|uniref:Mitochondrial pyruvate carrier n=1 Tax=Ditylenchus destructor TaxID=166010 RepID=A0AAD4RDQ0_9BILA|nr:putative mitochondrial pyruvate carrier 2 [Ditylenchus destructor]